MSHTDLNHLENAETLLAMLLAETSRELQAWVSNQQSLGALTAPLDDPTWGQAHFIPSHTAPPSHQTVQAPFHPPVPTAKRQENIAKSTTSKSATTMSMFKSLRKEQPKPQLHTPTERGLALEILGAKADVCRQCMLGTQRQRLFLGYGPVEAKIMFIAAGGNPKEPDVGRIMTGEAAIMLDNIVNAMSKLSPVAAPENIYMTNVMKCAHVPPRPQALECARKCLTLLREEVAIVAPKVIIVWGELAFRAMFGSDALISQVRGQVFKFEGIPTIPTHHPMEMVKNPKLKGRTWADLQQAVDIAKN